MGLTDNGPMNTNDTKELAMNTAAAEGFTPVNDYMAAKLAAEVGITNAVGMKQARKGGSREFRGALYLVLAADGSKHRFDLDNDLKLVAR